MSVIAKKDIINVHARKHTHTHTHTHTQSTYLCECLCAHLVVLRYLRDALQLASSELPLLTNLCTYVGVNVCNSVRVYAFELCMYTARVCVCVCVCLLRGAQHVCPVCVLYRLAGGQPIHTVIFVCARMYLYILSRMYHYILCVYLHVHWHINDVYVCQCARVATL